jgi:glyoxylase-like metal-dependent hydrolase (beta-lactamase superfamily II)
VWLDRRLSFPNPKAFTAEGDPNSAIIVGDDGCLVFDAQSTPAMANKVIERVRAVTDKPITTIINTNSHPGHSGNNFRFGGEGVVIVAHELTRSRLERRDHFKGANARYLPQTTFRDRLTLTRGKERIELYYFGAANTDGDVWVVFPSRRMMHIGDIVKKNDLPEIERISGGSGVAYAETMARGIAAIKDIDLVIAGHARGDAQPTLTWAELEAHQRQAGALLAAVREAMKSANSADAVASVIRNSAAFSDYEPRSVDEAVKATYAELVTRDRSTRLVSGRGLAGRATVLGTAGVVRRFGFAFPFQSYYVSAAR